MEPGQDEMTKDEARQIVIRQWRELPLANQLVENAAEFARLVAPSLQFTTVADREKLIAAWLVRDVEDRAPPLARQPARSRA